MGLPIVKPKPDGPPREDHAPVHSGQPDVKTSYTTPESNAAQGLLQEGRSEAAGKVVLLDGRLVQRGDAIAKGGKAQGGKGLTGYGGRTMSDEAQAQALFSHISYFLPECRPSWYQLGSTPLVYKDDMWQLGTRNNMGTRAGAVGNETAYSRTGGAWYKLDDELSDKETAVYVDDVNQRVNIAYRGSVSAYDWGVSDVQIGAGMMSGLQWKTDRIMYDKMASKYAGYRIDLTGHSLGGQRGYQIEKLHPDAYLTTFNIGHGGYSSLGGGFDMLRCANPFGKPSFCDQIEHHHTYGDLISASGRFSLPGKQYNYTRDCGTLDAVCHHDIAAYAGYIE